MERVILQCFQVSLCWSPFASLFLGAGFLWRSCTGPAMWLILSISLEPAARGLTTALGIHGGSSSRVSWGGATRTLRCGDTHALSCGATRCSFSGSTRFKLGNCGAARCSGFFLILWPPTFQISPDTPCCADGDCRWWCIATWAIRSLPVLELQTQRDVDTAVATRRCPWSW
jgi:hypothetical protein